jgi:hypothetical protein
MFCFCWNKNFETCSVFIPCCIFWQYDIPVFQYSSRMFRFICLIDQKSTVLYLSPDEMNNPWYHSYVSCRDARDEYFGAFIVTKYACSARFASEKETIKPQPIDIDIGFSHVDQAILTILDNCLFLSVREFSRKICLSRFTVDCLPSTVYCPLYSGTSHSHFTSLHITSHHITLQFAICHGYHTFRLQSRQGAECRVQSAEFR